ncbi:MAG: agmatine deiminase family protein [Chitinophagales bacterium]|nr:agmatine deiminase family protein [Chitinophagales bacterium]
MPYKLPSPHADSDWAPYLEQVIPCFIQIIEAISKYEKVLVVCNDIEEVAQHLQYSQSKQTIYTELPSNDTWARDHGIITVEEDGRFILMDFIFNGWGLKFSADKDNIINHQLFEKGIFKVEELYKVGLVLEGGGIESDGKGVIMTTRNCQLSPNRNPHLDMDAIEAALEDTFGAEKILWLEYGHLVGDDTDSHIDTLARFCDENTIAYIQCKDTNDEHYESLALMEKELQSFSNIDGKPYRLVPLPFPDACYDEDENRLPATYANFLILNNAVLVPIYGVTQDEEALQTLSEIFTDREIIGINCLPLILQHGSLHCVTMQFPKDVL